ncbi:MAG: diaminopimelate epimerase [Acidimicrobiales bacterium]
MTTLSLAKYHGLGNDFLVLLDIEGTSPISADLARRVCARHRGIGADGLIRVTRPPLWGDGDDALPDEAVLVFELRNADGSPAEMSGNGMRCLAHGALDAGLVTAASPFVVATSAGPRRVTVRPLSGVTDGVGPAREVWASVEMGRPVVSGEGERCNVGHGQLRVDMGNPHLVVLGRDPGTIAVEALGPDLERAVPERQNVEFVALGPGADEITMRVWERGVGETLACGTGACAAAVAMHHWGRVGRRVTVHQPGGDALVEMGGDGAVSLSGPSVRVARCQVEVRSAARAAGAELESADDAEHCREEAVGAP